jgi:hypothetical protein
LDYQRAGLSYLLDKRIVTVRHLANDEYKRSWLIPNAWVYIASAGFVVVMWLVFVINFLYISSDYSFKCMYHAWQMHFNLHGYSSGTQLFFDKTLQFCKRDK